MTARRRWTRCAVVLGGLVVGAGAALILSSSHASATQERGAATPSTVDNVVRPMLPQLVTPTRKPAVRAKARPTAKHVLRNTIRPVVRDAVLPVAKPVEREVVRPALRDVVRPVAKPVARDIVRPVVRDAVRPVVTPVVRAVVKPVVDGVVRPIVQPVVRDIVRPVVTSVGDETVEPTNRPMLRAASKSSPPTTQTSQTSYSVPAVERSHVISPADRTAAQADLGSVPTTRQELAASQSAVLAVHTSSEQPTPPQPAPGAPSGTQLTSASAPMASVKKLAVLPHSAVQRFATTGTAGDHRQPLGPQPGSRPGTTPD